jgi:hypothetical protein
MPPSSPPAGDLGGTLRSRTGDTWLTLPGRPFCIPPRRRSRLRSLGELLGPAENHGTWQPLQVVRLRRACSPNWLARARTTAPLLKRSGRPTTMPRRGRAPAARPVRVTMVRAGRPLYDVRCAYASARAVAPLTRTVGLPPRLGTPRRGSLISPGRAPRPASGGWPGGAPYASAQSIAALTDIGVSFTPAPRTRPGEVPPCPGPHAPSGSRMAGRGGPLV